MTGTRRHVLITGASRGIGRLAVERFARGGWSVIAGVRDPATLEPFDVAGVEVVHLDLNEPEQIASAADRAHALAGGALDCVVNNAGWALFGAVEDVDLDDARRQFETQLFGPVALLQEVLPRMREAGRGAVVNVSSLSGRVPLPLFGMYSAAKLSLTTVSEALALEMAPFGVRVTVIEAGVVDTEFARSTVISGAVGTPATPYAAPRDAILGRLRAVRGDAPVRAQDVADAVFAAADDPDAPLHVVLADEVLRDPVFDVEGRGPSAAVLDGVRALFEF